MGKEEISKKVSWETANGINVRVTWALIKFRALVCPIIIFNLHPYHSHKRNDLLNQYMAMGHGSASGLKSGRSAAPFLRYNQERIILFFLGAIKYSCPTSLKFLKVEKNYPLNFSLSI